MGTMSNSVVVGGSGGYVVVREKPGTQYTRVGQLNKGTLVTLKDSTAQGWAKISFNGYDCYVSRQFVDTSWCDEIYDRTSYIENAERLMFGTSNLKYSSSPTESMYVYNLQWCLKHLGYNPGTVDGKFGQGTDSAVRAFQRDWGLTVDGIFGSNSRNQMIHSLRQVN